MKAFTVVLAGIALAAALPEPLEKRVCPHDNLLRCLIGTPSLAIPFCSSSVGIYPTASTVWVTVSPTASVSATSTAFSTATSTSTVSETSTSTTATTSLATPTPAPTLVIPVTTYVKRTSTIVVPPPGGCDDVAAPNKRAPATSLACIKNLNPAPSAVSSACSCFSGSYGPSISPVTSLTVLAPVTVTAATITTTVPVTVGAVATVTVYTTSTITTVIIVTATAICSAP